MIQDEIKEWAKRCREEGIAIAIYADGTWNQLGGEKRLYGTDPTNYNSKSSMLETIRMLKMKINNLSGNIGKRSKPFPCEGRGTGDKCPDCGIEMIHETIPLKELVKPSRQKKVKGGDV
jgi:hypothetical protein